MSKKIIKLLILTIGLLPSAFSQSVINLEDSKEIVEYTLNQEQLKILASDIDLLSLKILEKEDSPSTKPDILMPTSHANEYAILDFSNCMNGRYLFQAYKNQEIININITFQKL